MEAASDSKRTPVLAYVGPLLGALGVAGLILIAVTSLTSFTPGDAVVIPTVWIAVLGWLGSIILGVLLLRGRNRTSGVVSLVLAGVTLVGFIVLINAVPY